MAASCILIFIYRPVWGVFFIIATHPVTTCSYDIAWSALQPVEIISAVNIPYGTRATSPLTSPFSAYPFQIAAFIMLPSLIIHCNPFSRQLQASKSLKIIYTTLSFFFIWGIIVSLYAPYPDKALFGLSRFLCITILISYVVRFVKDPTTLRKVLLTYCCAAILMSLLSFYSTYYGFEHNALLYSNHGFNIFQKQALFNTPSSYNPEVMSMLPGFGIAGKHEFSTYIATGIISSAYLFYTEKNRLLSLFYPLIILTLYTSLYYAPCKLSIVGILFGVLLVSFLSPLLRKHISIILLLMILLNIVALISSNYVRPDHTKKTAGATQHFKVVNNESEFEPGIQERVAIWRKAIKTIKQSYGLGIGPDMFNRSRNHNIAFSFPHAHNIVITLLTEYGFPAILCMIILGVVSIRHVLPIITSKTHLNNATHLPVITVAVCFLTNFFEYSFDCFVWIPQLWILGALMWVSVDIANKNTTSASLSDDSKYQSHQQQGM